MYIETVICDFTDAHHKDVEIAHCTRRGGCLRGREWSVFNQRVTGTVSMHTL
uniref:Uncharacterized protein n=1 Tax=Arion vulgaris TaxID=1028688 RepID=A0A0B6XX72_9EUPU